MWSTNVSVLWEAREPNECAESLMWSTERRAEVGGANILNTREKRDAHIG